MEKQFPWYQLDEIPQESWTTNERIWLLHPGSLTQRLRDVTGGRIQHRLLQEALATPETEEAVTMGIPLQSVTLVREIDWWYAGKLWVAARAVIPAKTLEAKGDRLKNIGRRSLGDILFANDNLIRSDFEFAPITKNHPYYHRIFHHVLNETTAVWARRSLFYFDGHPLLVSEIFLPALFSDTPNT